MRAFVPGLVHPAGKLAQEGRLSSQAPFHDDSHQKALGEPVNEGKCAQSKGTSPPKAQTMDRTREPMKGSFAFYPTGRTKIDTSNSKPQKIKYPQQHKSTYGEDILPF